MIDNILIKQVAALMQSKEMHFLDVKNNYRYERKFTVPNEHSLSRLINIVKRNSFLFREVYYERQVNNIYLDTVGYNDYFDNVLGVSNRKKIRIRWYGEMFGEVRNPVLEIKIKKGIVGDKWSYKIEPFTLDNTFTNDQIQTVFKSSNLPVPILESVKMVSPTLLNTYKRRYFLSADKKFRITLDFKLLYFKINKKFNHFSLKPSIDSNKIIELKYNLEDDSLANRVSSEFPFRLNKNSKYVNGVDTIKNFPK